MKVIKSICAQMILADGSKYNYPDIQKWEYEDNRVFLTKKDSSIFILMPTNAAFTIVSEYEKGVLND